MRFKYKTMFSALVAVFAFSGLASASLTSTAMATCTTNVLCGPTENLKDDSFGPSEKDGYGSTLQAVNTEEWPVSLWKEYPEEKIVEAAKEKLLLGLKLNVNPVTSTKECKVATGWVTFVDGHWTTGTLYDNTSPGFNGAWPFSIDETGTGCGINAGKVKIENVALYSPSTNPLVAGTTVTGTLSGTWVSSCPGSTSGGIRFNRTQGGLTVKNAAGSGDAIFEVYAKSEGAPLCVTSTQVGNVSAGT